MKKKILAVMICSVLCLAACGKKDPVEETKQPQDGKTEQQATVDKTENTASGDEKKEPTGYFFTSESVNIYMDQDITEIVNGIGEPVSYFEVASCAFEGLDKVYTYDHFVINTYPLEGKDLVSSVVLMDDLVETPEGAYIGCSVTDVVDAYGEGYKETAGAYTYSKDGMDLMFLFDGDSVKSIQYFSGILNTAN